MKLSPLASRIATTYMLQRQALVAEGDHQGPDSGPEGEGSGGPEAQTAMPKSKVGQQALLEALGKLQEAYDELDDDAFQKALENVKKLSVPGQSA